MTQFGVVTQVGRNILLGHTTRLMFLSLSEIQRDTGENLSFFVPNLGRLGRLWSDANKSILMQINVYTMPF